MRIINRHANQLQCLLNKSAELSCHYSFLSPPLFEADSIIEEAQRKTGLQDLGGEEFVLYFRRYMEIVSQRHAQMPPFSQILFHKQYLRRTITRLRMVEYIKKNPEVDDIVVERPIFIVGMPRTGTTVLQNILGDHPSHRTLEFWELENPVPIHSNKMIDKIRRLTSSTCSTKLTDILIPDLKKMHHITARSHEECHHLFGHLHTLWNVHLFLGCPHSVQDELYYKEEDKMLWAYKEYKRMLQILIHQHPASSQNNRLVLKCPEHVFFLDSLLNVFPDACIAWCHRDPTPAVASYCGQLTAFRRVLYGNVEPKSVGPHASELIRGGIMRALEVREKKLEVNNCIMDVQFEDIVKNKIKVLKDLENEFQLGRWNGWEKAILKYQNAKRADKMGSFVYTPEMYGLVPERVWKDFESYMQKFDVKRETKRSKSTESPPHTRSYRATLTSVFVTVLSSVFLIFCAQTSWWSMWPTHENCFVTYLENPDCFCERPRGEKPGDVWIAQPVNSWSNIPFVIVGFCIAYVFDTKSSVGKRNWWENINPMTRTEIYPIGLSCITCLMGPSSAFLHASLTEHGRQIDMISMYMLGMFLLVYNLSRYFGLAALKAFGAIYFPTMIALSIWTILFNPIKMNRIVFGVIIVMAGVLELLMIFSKLRNPCTGKRRNTVVDYRMALAAVLSIGTGQFVWSISTAGGSFCFPDSFFQGHAIWHTCAALAVGFTFLYWLSENTVSSPVERTPSDNNTDEKLQILSRGRCEH